MNTTDPGTEFRTIRMSTVAIDDLNSRSQWDFVTEDAQCRSTLHDPAAKRVLRLEADNQYRVLRIRCTLRKMV